MGQAWEPCTIHHFVIIFQGWEKNKISGSKTKQKIWGEWHIQSIVDLFLSILGLLNGYHRRNEVSGYIAAMSGNAYWPELSHGLQAPLGHGWLNGLAQCPLFERCLAVLPICFLIDKWSEIWDIEDCFFLRCDFLHPKLGNQLAFQTLKVQLLCRCHLPLSGWFHLPWNGVKHNRASSGMVCDAFSLKSSCEINISVPFHKRHEPGSLLVTLSGNSFLGGPVPGIRIPVSWQLWCHRPGCCWAMSCSHCQTRY